MERSVSYKLSSAVSFPGRDIRFREVFRILFKIQRYFGFLIKRYPGEDIIRNTATEKFNKKFGEEYSKIGLASWTIRCIIYASYMILFCIRINQISATTGGLFSDCTAQLLSRIFLGFQGFFNLLFFGIFSDSYRKLLLAVDELSFRTIQTPLYVFVRISGLLFFILPLPYVAYYLHYIANGFNDLTHEESVPIMIYSSISIFLIIYYEKNIAEPVIRDSDGRRQQIKTLFILAEIVKKVDLFFAHLIMLNIFFTCGGVCFACHSVRVYTQQEKPSEPLARFLVLLLTNVIFWVLTFVGFLAPSVYLNEKAKRANID